MTIKEYITGKFQTFGIQMSEADLLDITLTGTLNGDDDVTNNNLVKVNVGIARFIPSLLLRASSISESGFSMSWDINALKTYYSYLCNLYGITDELNDKPKVRFL